MNWEKLVFLFGYFAGETVFLRKGTFNVGNYFKCFRTKKADHFFFSSQMLLHPLRRQVTCEFRDVLSKYFEFITQLVFQSRDYVIPLENLQREKFLRFFFCLPHLNKVIEISIKALYCTIYSHKINRKEKETWGCSTRALSVKSVIIFSLATWKWKLNRK